MGTWGSCVATASARTYSTLARVSRATRRKGDYAPRAGSASKPARLRTARASVTLRMARGATTPWAHSACRTRDASNATAKFTTPGRANSPMSPVGNGPGLEHEVVADVRVGTVLANKYLVERVLGSGDMAVVVAAHHLQLDERIALKFLQPEGMQDPEALARFERKARAAVKIKNEHVARTIDVGALENGTPYIVME